MLDKEILEILEQLKADLPDFSYIYPTVQTAIARWIASDREYHLKRERKNAKRRRRPPASSKPLPGNKIQRRI